MIRRGLDILQMVGRGAVLGVQTERPVGASQSSSKAKVLVTVLAAREKETKLGFQQSYLKMPSISKS